MTKIIKGDLILTEDNVVFEESIKVEGSIISKDYRRNLKVAGDINARDINARDINAGDINAWDIDARDINAGDIICETRKKKSIKCKTIARIYIKNRSNLERKEYDD